MKWLFYMATLAAALLYPSQRADVAKLQPVELVCMYIEEGAVVLETDTGDLGKGDSVTGALHNLKETTAGIVYLDTAAYLLVDEDVQYLIPEIIPYLKEKVRLCQMDEKPDLELAAAYLNVHSPEKALGTWEEGVPLDTLQWEQERLTLKKA